MDREYLQLIREDNGTIIYYCPVNKKFVAYINTKEWKPSFNYYISIPLVFYIGNTLDEYGGKIITNLRFVKPTILTLGILIAFIFGLVLNTWINKEIGFKGRELYKYSYTDADIATGKKQLKQQKRIIYFWGVFDFVLLALFYITDKFMIWILFEGVLLCIVAIIISVKPLKRKGMYLYIYEGIM